MSRGQASNDKDGKIFQTIIVINTIKVNIMELFFGVDVGKHILDVHICPFGKSFSVNNNEAGIKELIKRIEDSTADEHQLKLVVCESTGGYEKLLVRSLREHNIPIHVAHSNKVRNFARALGKFAKTDKIDASILSEYASKFQPKPQEGEISEDLRQLKELQVRRSQLMEEMTRETNRLDKGVSADLSKSINRHVKWLKNEIGLIEKEIKKFIAEHKEIKSQVDLMESIPGVGKITASIILTDLPEIRTLEDKKLSALAGVAPMNRDSGSKKGRRRIIGGRATLRKFLYMATIASIRFNHVIRSFYQRLRKKDKPAKVAIVAAMHKLLFIIKSVLQRQSVWVENLA